MKRRGVIGYGAHTGGSNSDNPYQNSHLSTRHSGMVTHDDRSCNRGANYWYTTW